MPSHGKSDGTRFVSTTCGSGWVLDPSHMWNDTDTPLAYFITFRSYGTWLHGDERGSTDRHNNIYGTPHIPANKNWNDHNRKSLAGAPLKLSAIQRKTVEAAIRETCTIRSWSLLAISVRTNHVHTVVSTGGKKGELALNAFKANATERCGRKAIGHRPKARGPTRAAAGGCGMNKASRMR